MILLSQLSFSQQKSLSEVKTELLEKLSIEKVNYIILSRTIFTLQISENGQNSYVNNYKGFLIKQESGYVSIEEFSSLDKPRVFKIEHSKIFKIIKDNFRSLSKEKFKDFEYSKNGEKIYLKESNSGQMEIDLSYKRITYHNEFDELLLEFSSNSKMKLVQLISEIEKDLKPFYNLHPFYVNH